MRQLVYDFSVLEAIDNNDDFSDKVTDHIFPTLLSIFNWKRWVMCVYIARYANAGKFKDIGRYRITVTFVGSMVYAKLRRFI